MDFGNYILTYRDASRRTKFRSEVGEYVGKWTCNSVSLVFSCILILKAHGYEQSDSIHRQLEWSSNEDKGLRETTDRLAHDEIGLTELHYTRVGMRLHG